MIACAHCSRESVGVRAGPAEQQSVTERVTLLLMIQRGWHCGRGSVGCMSSALPAAVLTTHVSVLAALRQQ